MTVDAPIEKLKSFFEHHPEVSQQTQCYVFTDIPDDEAIMEIDTCGAGCMMIRREVLEKVKPPWFSFSAWGLNEDWNFCKKAKSEGIRICVDLSVMTGHSATYYVDHIDFLQYVRFAQASMKKEVETIRMH